MMIRERQGRHRTTVLLIRVSWDPDRKRSVQKVVDSFSAYEDRLPVSVAGKLEPEEKAQVEAWIAAKVAARKAVLLPGTGPELTRLAVELADALEDPARAEMALARLDHLALYNAVDRLAKVLRKRGLTRPPRPKKGAQAAPEAVPAPAA